MRNRTRIEPPVTAADLKKAGCFALSPLLFSSRATIQIDMLHTTVIARKLRSNTATFSQVTSTTDKSAIQSAIESLLQRDHSTAMIEKVPAVRSARAAMSPIDLERCPEVCFRPRLAS